MLRLWDYPDRLAFAEGEGRQVQAIVHAGEFKLDRDLRLRVHDPDGAVRLVFDPDIPDCDRPLKRPESSTRLIASPQVRHRGNCCHPLTIPMQMITPTGMRVRGGLRTSRRQRSARGLDDIQMDSAASGAAHGPVFGAGAAGDDTQHRERGGAIRTIRKRWGRLQGLFGKRHGEPTDCCAGIYGFAKRGLKRSIWAFASAIAASGSDHAKPTSRVGKAIPSIITGAWSAR